MAQVVDDVKVELTGNCIELDGEIMAWLDGTFHSGYNLTVIGLPFSCCQDPLELFTDDEWSDKIGPLRQLMLKRMKDPWTINKILELIDEEFDEDPLSWSYDQAMYRAIWAQHLSDIQGT